MYRHANCSKGNISIIRLGFFSKKNSSKSILHWLLSWNTHRGLTQSSARSSDWSKYDQSRVQASDQLQLTVLRPSNGGQFGKLGAELSVRAAHWRSKGEKYNIKDKIKDTQFNWCKAPETSRRHLTAELQRQQSETCRSTQPALCAGKGEEQQEVSAADEHVLHLQVREARAAKRFTQEPRASSKCYNRNFISSL